MKKLFTLLLGLCLTLPALAQKPRFTPDHGALLDGKTIVKANITSPIFKNYSFAAERILTKGLSLQLGLATMPKGSLPLSSTLNKVVNSNDFNFNTFQLGSFYLTPELRWYTGGGYGHGFYLMAYYRYQSYNLSGYDLNLDLHGSNNARRQVDVALSGKLKTHSFGIGFGAQWLFGRNKNIVLDWNILGAHYGSGKLDLNGNIVQGGLTAEEITSLRQELSSSVSDLPAISISEQDVTVDQQQVALKNVSTPWAFFRSSLSIGFRF